jgi:tetratricopeptide (TPR) repeat protein
METKRSPNSLSQILALGLSLMALFAIAPSIALGADDLEARANAAIQESDWPKAAELYSELAAAKPDNAAAWFRLGRATVMSDGNAAAARAAFEKALELGFAPGPALLGIARSYATRANSNAALDTLERLADQGPSQFVVSQLKGDEAFTSLVSDDRFQRVITRLTPCTSEKYRQFDFWLGSWNVVNPQGQQVGTNNVTAALDGCLLIENWESARGGQKGMSMNYYDRDQETWSQIYRDSSGNITQWPELKGGFVKGSMVLESAPDTQPQTRWIWTKQDDGRVRQMAESSSDKGTTWSTVWDSYYVLVND